jgi:hypothetical protein
MEEPIITVIVKQSPATVFELLAEFFIAQIDRIQLAGFVADCADEATTLGLDENARLFRLTELLFGGGAFGNPEASEKSTSHVALLFAAYRAQKSLNMHRARAQLPNEPALVVAKETALETSTTTDLTADAAPELVVHVGDVPAETAAANDTTTEVLAEIVTGSTDVDAQRESEPQVQRRRFSRLNYKGRFTKKPSNGSAS